MQKLISQLKRLYLPAGVVPDGALERHVLGQDSAGVALVSADGNTRALAIPFLHQGGGEETQHWTLLCAVANAMQVELGLPAPAVSISGAHAYGLWLSFEAPLSVAMAQQLDERLRKAYFPDSGHGALAASARRLFIRAWAPRLRAKPGSRWRRRSPVKPPCSKAWKVSARHNSSMPCRR